MAATGYIVGQTVRLKAEFRNEAGVLTDPTSVKCKVLNSSGTTTSFNNPTKDSTGIYHQDVEITKPTTGGGGLWYYRFEGSGSLVAANENSFPVQQSQF